MALTGTSTNLGLVNIGANHPENESASSSLSSIINGLITAVDNFAGIQVLSADGAITVTAGAMKTLVSITKATAAAITIAAPTAGLPSAGGNDGQEIVVVSETAAAHVITSGTDGFNAKGSSGTATYGAAKGNVLRIVARNGHWWTVGNTGVTIA